MEVACVMKEPENNPIETRQNTELLEYYGDVFWTHLNPWSASITFGLRKITPEETDRPQLRVRMSLQQAKALAVILLNSIRRYETDAGVEVELPNDVLKGIGIAPEDWKKFNIQ
jgi:hypothetical protein